MLTSTITICEVVDVYVVYLVWPPMGTEPLHRFAASYREYSAGLDHRLLFVLKGASTAVIAAQVRALAAELGAEHIQVPATGRDLHTYRLVAERISCDALCLLNSSSQILGRGWLRMLADALAQPSVGLVGATGSFESALSAAPRPLRPFLRSRYPPFPNPHVRTNAFMLRRDLMLELDWPPGAGGKRRALELESGFRGVTRQVQARGLRTLVVGRDGRAYAPAEWPNSCTFRSGTQENLLVADNRTRQYDNAPGPRRSELARFAWGDAVGVSLPPRVAAPPT